MWLTQGVEDIPAPPDQSQPPARSTRGENRYRSNIKGGPVSLVRQLGIIVVAFGIAALALLAFLVFIGRSGAPAPADQAVLDAQ
jgi:hypothetical protein